MGKLWDKFIDWALQEGRWPLLLPPVLIPVAFSFIQSYFEYSFRETFNSEEFWVFSGGVMLGSAVLSWITQAKGVKLARSKLWLRSALGVAGVIVVVAGLCRPSSDKLVIVIATFSSFGGADGDAFSHSIFEELNDRAENGTLPLIPMHFENTEVKGPSRTAQKNNASEFGRSRRVNAHIVLWGTLTKNAEKDGTLKTRVAPQLTFVKSIQAVRLQEGDIEGFNAPKVEDLDIAEDDYEKSVADVVTLVSGLAYYKARDWDGALKFFNTTALAAATLYKGLCFLNKGQEATGSDREGDFLRAIASFKSVLAAVEESPHPSPSYSREADDLRLAATINHASALANLSSLQAPEEAMASLIEARKLYENICNLYPKDKFPLDWAYAKSNLGAVLTDMAVLSGNQPRGLREAISNYRDALDVYPQDEPNLAITRRNLATALTELGAMECGQEAEEFLRCAVVEYDQAVRVFKLVDASKRTIATTEVYKAYALAELGSRDLSRAESLLQQSVRGCRNALAVLSQPDLNWADAEANLAYGLYQQGRRTSGEGGSRLLLDAIEACKKALTVYPEGDIGWSVAQTTLGGSLTELSKRVNAQRGNERLQEAIAAYKDALRFLDMATYQQQWAKANDGLGIALIEMVDRERSPAGASLLNDAISSFDRALSVLDEPRCPERYKDVSENRSKAIHLRDSLGSSTQ